MTEITFRTSVEKDRQRVKYIFGSLFPPRGITSHDLDFDYLSLTEFVFFFPSYFLVPLLYENDTHRAGDKRQRDERQIHTYLLAWAVREREREREREDERDITRNEISHQLLVLCKNSQAPLIKMLAVCAVPIHTDWKKSERGC